MRDTAKPRRVKAKITRVVTEWAIVILDRDGNVEEFEETLDEIECGEVLELHSIDSVLSIHA
ncbi:hypothetical protein [Pseudomonas sp. O230]|uniref:hypothetical protein n=1 Tax=Pseudomonas sp. O230 TaxID=3159450 RepID=UPI00387ABDED